MSSRPEKVSYFPPMTIAKTKTHTKTNTNTKTTRFFDKKTHKATLTKRHAKRNTKRKTSGSRTKCEGEVAQDSRRRFLISFFPETANAV